MSGLDEPCMLTTGCATGVSSRVLFSTTMESSLRVNSYLKEMGAFTKQGRTTFANRLAKLLLGRALN